MPAAAKSILCVALAMAFLAGQAGAKKLLTDMALQWTPTVEIDELEPPASAEGIGALSFEVTGFVDERRDTAMIGENREEKKPLPVSTRADVPAWVAEGFRDVLSRLGLRVVDHGGDIVLSGALRRFFVTETHTYDGEVAVWVTAKTPGGELLWEGVVTGASHRFGRSYKADNYNETLSDATFYAAARLLQDDSFRTAVRRQP